MPRQITEAQIAKLLEETRELQKAYQITFSGPSGAAVLADLRPFCRADKPCWSEDQRHHARLEGRREVWLHANDWVNLPVEELLQRQVGDSYSVIKIEPEDEENG